MSDYFIKSVISEEIHFTAEDPSKYKNIDGMQIKSILLKR